jgi:2-octaprenyl-6-methoxyphenol hydroxylase
LERNRVVRDVVIVGAGPVGATLAIALREADLDVVVIDARTPGTATRTDRSLALSHGARLIFERLGVWAPLAAIRGAVSPITAIDVSQASGFGAARLDAAEHGLPALGYVVSYRALQQALDDALRQTSVEVRFGASADDVMPSADRARVDVNGASPIEARLAVIADGAASSVRGVDRRRHEYGQVAVVATVSVDTPHHGVAYERFTRDGPIALLPQRDDYGLVWTLAPDDAAHVLALDEPAFVAALSARFGGRMRGFTAVRERRSFPLTLEVARNTTAPRVAVIGNAAQALHPIAGQGFNLGLRDAFELARVLVATRRDDVGSDAMLARYRRVRAIDRRAGIAFTHGLVRLFGNDRPWLHVPRGIGLLLLDAAAPLKRSFTRSMLYGLH